MRLAFSNIRHLCLEDTLCRRIQTLDHPLFHFYFFITKLEAKPANPPQFSHSFPPEDSEYEVKNMSPGIGELDVYPSIWGHWAGGPPGNMDDVKYLDERLARMLKEN